VKKGVEPIKKKFVLTQFEMRKHFLFKLTFKQICDIFEAKIFID